jgi:acetoacetyl-CoA reductase
MKTALVTGGSTGIGFATVKSLTKSGFKVVAAYNETTPKQAIDNVVFKKLDITSRSSCLELLTELDNLDLFPSTLVNNAGITSDSMFHNMSYEAWLQVINVNLISLFNLTQPIFTRMREKKYGRIINISSVNANKGQAGQVNYCAAKAGIQGFTKALAQEGARYGITVNTISPGYTDTSMVENIKPEILDKIKQSIPMGRLASPDEIAAQVNYLTTELAGYITGANFQINGGMYSS